MLTLNAVAKHLPDDPERWLFRDVHLHLEAGELVAIRGESGVGKSTLLHIIAGLDRKDAGNIHFQQHDLDKLSDDARTLLRRQKMGFVFQAFHLLPQLSIAENIALPWRLNGMPRRGLDGRVLALATRLGIDHRLHALPRELSGGEMQRVAVARAVMHQPALILADEPTGSLDPDSATEVLGLLLAIAMDSEAAVLMVTHSDTAAAQAQRRLLLVRDGLQPLA